MSTRYVGVVPATSTMDVPTHVSPKEKPKISIT